LRNVLKEKNETEKKQIELSFALEEFCYWIACSKVLYWTVAGHAHYCGVQILKASRIANKQWQQWRERQ